VRPVFDVDELEEGSYALLPLLSHRLQELAISDPVLPRLRGAYRKTWVINKLSLSLLRRALEALNSAGVAAMIVNDALAALRIYTDLGLRPITELEVVIRPAAAARAWRALEGAGWRRLQRPSPPELAVGSTDGLRFEIGEPSTAVVLRSHPVIGAAEPGAAENELWGATVETFLDGIPTRAIDSTAGLLYTCVNGVRGRWWRAIQWVVDATMILRSDQAVDWQRFVRVVERQSLVLPVREALTYLACLLDDPVPLVWHRQILRAPVTRRDVIAYRIGSSGGRIVGSVPHLLGEHARLTRTQPTLRVLVAIPGFLKRAWGLEHWWWLPPLAVGALRQRLTQCPTRGRGRASRGVSAATPVLSRPPAVPAKAPAADVDVVEISRPTVR
jgi:hypothetical protein